MRGGRRSAVVVAALATVVPFLVLLAASEAYLRWRGELERIGPGDAPAGPDRHLVLREYQPDSRYSFAPPEVRRLNAEGPVPDFYEIRTDRDGFIEPGRVHAQADRTIVFLGGSTTECMFVAPERRFPHRAGRLLEERLGLKVNALNGGRSGNNVQHANLLLVGKVAPLRPDWVVLMEAINDLGVLAAWGGYWNSSSDYALVRRPESGFDAAVHRAREALIPAVTRAYKRLKARIKESLRSREGERPAAPPQTWTPEAWVRDYESALRQFVATARAWGVRPALMTQPQLREGEWRRGAGDYVPAELFARYLEAHDLFNETLRRIARDEGALLIDLAAADWTARELYDGLHFTDEGAERAAAIIADALAAAEAGR